MERTKPRALAASSRSSSWLLLLYLAAVAALQTRAQPDGNGFISIDCGLVGSRYEHTTTNLNLWWYEPDAAFTDAGENHDIPLENVRRPLLTLRSFPNGTRNCYTLRSLTAANKYLIRAEFLYGNYDRLGRPPVFDLYIGVNYWVTVHTTGGNTWCWWEAIVVVPDDFVQVCLVNTGSGNPFISGLYLRPLKSSLYPLVNATQGLNLHVRGNFGPTDAGDIVRYPDDPYDRIWYPLIDTTNWNATSTEMTVQNPANNDFFEPPSKVMQTAVTPRVASGSIRFMWTLNPRPNEPPPGCIHFFHFSELQALGSKDVRELYVIINGNLRNPDGLTPQYLASDAIYSAQPFGPSNQNQYNVVINATANSTLPPIINAYEVFVAIPTTNISTDSQDLSAITAIKKVYGVTKDWVGDPCDTFGWTGLRCNSSAISVPPRITTVNMSFSSLNGDISSAFANLTAVQYIDLSHNNLTGTIPDALSQLPSLKTLDLTGNNLSGSIPPGLLKKIQAGSLNLRYDNNPNLCVNGNSCMTTKAKSKLAIYIAVPAALILVVGFVGVLFFLLRCKRKGNTNTNERSVSHMPAGDAHSSLRLVENRRFTYKELEKITNKFQHVIGRGGFGSVYSGFLEDGSQVAVKLRSETSNQGVKEFVTEAQILMRIHHKHLVSMIGYCKDGEYMALVYEYMSEGTLQEHIAGKHLTWRQKLRIALESAQGLEYLHKGCNPPLIHRDVKTTNILLNAKLEAKVADFGLSRAFNLGNCTHVSTTTLAYTPGYVDPEYQATMQPTTKSDVFSFGVVLLELVTGKPAILRNDPEPISIIKWVRLRLARGDIDSVMDERMNVDAHDINAIWKTADVALKCTALESTQRPTMTEVVAQLQECLDLEEGRADGGVTESFYAGSRGDLNSSYNTTAYATSGSRGRAAFETVEMMDAGPATR